MAELIPSCHLCGILMDTNPMLAVYEVAPHPKHPNHCINCVKRYPHLLNGGKQPSLPMAPVVVKDKDKLKGVLSILSLLNSGLSYPQISQRIGVSSGTIPRKLKEAGKWLGGDLITVKTGHRTKLTDFGKQILERGV